VLHEAEGRSSLGALANLELVGERLDDRDPETALGELLGVERAARIGRGVEALAFVGHLDDELVRMELVEDLDVPVSARVGMAHGVRAGLGQGELQVAEHLGS
jgi:hypothetical protein